ncbi:hypothetical protein [Pseudoroseicyclus sp. CXY001]|uniref:hypothetical protein n=1 Tax=Pseudoroseicyclus sp. CXY001 TaxID=3242492 RepID=UPI003570FD25
MADLTHARIRAGIWHGEITGRMPERLIVTYQGRIIEGLEIEPHEAGTSLRLLLPREMISEGAQTCLIADADTGETIAEISLIAGVPVAEDLRVEVASLRAELDLVKSVLRRLAMEAEARGAEPAAAAEAARAPRPARRKI